MVGDDPEGEGASTTLTRKQWQLQLLSEGKNPVCAQRPAIARVTDHPGSICTQNDLFQLLLFSILTLICIS